MNWKDFIFKVTQLGFIMQMDKAVTRKSKWTV